MGLWTWDFPHFHLCSMLHIDSFQVNAYPSDADTVANN